MRIPKATARRPTAWPTRPAPRRPSVRPRNSRPSNSSGRQPVHVPPLMSSAPSTTRRAQARIRAHVRSAVASVSTSGVCVTFTPRISAATTSTLSCPTPQVAMTFNLGRCLSSVPPIQRDKSGTTATYSPRGVGCSAGTQVTSSPARCSGSSRGWSSAAMRTGCPTTAAASPAARNRPPHALDELPVVLRRVLAPERVRGGRRASVGPPERREAARRLTGGIASAQGDLFLVPRRRAAPRRVGRELRDRVLVALILRGCRERRGLLPFELQHQALCRAPRVHRDPTALPDLGRFLRRRFAREREQQRAGGEPTLRPAHQGLQVKGDGMERKPPMSGACTRSTQRTGWDSNPRYPCGHTGFRDRPFQPLTHLSTDRVGFEPTKRLPVYTLSRRVPSAARPPILV